MFAQNWFKNISRTNYHNANDDHHWVANFGFYYNLMITVHFFDQFSQAPAQKQGQRLEEYLGELQFLHNQVREALPPEVQA